MVQNIVEMQPKRRGRSFSLEVFLLLWLAIFAVMTIVVHILYEYMHQQLNEDRRVHSYSTLQTIQQPKQRYAVAIVIPYIDQPLPVWFDAFVRATKAKNDDASNITIHWLIFHNRKDIDYYNSTYVKVIHIANDELAKRFHSLFERQDSSVGWKPKIPYRMVEHKAAFGYLFRDYLHDYNYWGYGDLDILASAAYMQKVLSVIVSADNGGSTVLQSYDVITFTYGDHYSLYLRGQMTIFKKTRISMDLMWRMCTFDNRGGSSSVSRIGGMKGFQSAEGCISKVITTFYTSKNLSVLYLPLQLSDALLLRGRLQEYHSQYTLAERESLFYAGRLMKCYLNHSTVDAMDVDSYTQQYLLKPEQLQFMFVSQAKDSIYRVQFRQPRCSYWISPEYDVCIDKVPPNAIISRRLSPLHKPDEGDVKVVPKQVHNHFYFTNAYRNTYNVCIEAVFVHFQGWKHNYYFFTSRAALLAVPDRLDQATIISRYGLIPWHWKVSSTKIDDDWKLIQKSIIHTDEENVSYTQAQRNLLPSRYCLRFSKDLKTCNVWLDSKQHIVIHQIPQEFRDLRQDDGISSTLLLLLPPRLIDPQHNRDLEIYFQTLHSEIVLCEGLKYLIVVVWPNSKDVRLQVKALLAKIYMKEGIMIRIVLVTLPQSLTARDFSDYSIDKTMYNVGLDALSTLSSRISASSAMSNRVFILPVEGKFSHLTWKMLTDARQTLPTMHDTALIFGSLSDIMEHRRMLPVLMNIHSLHHGPYALRLPEELNGRLCVANVLLHVVQGLGYQVFQVTANQASPIATVITVSEFYSIPLHAISNCAMTLQQQHVQTFLATLDFYYARMDEIRADGRGILSIASNREFAFGASSNAFYEAQ